MNQNTFMGAGVISLIACLLMSLLTIYLFDQEKIDGIFMIGIGTLIASISLLCLSLKMFSLGVSKPIEIKDREPTIKNPKL